MDTLFFDGGSADGFLGGTLPLDQSAVQHEPNVDHFTKQLGQQLEHSIKQIENTAEHFTKQLEHLIQKIRDNPNDEQAKHEFHIVQHSFEQFQKIASHLLEQENKIIEREARKIARTG